METRLLFLKIRKVKPCYQTFNVFTHIFSFAWKAFSMAHFGLLKPSLQLSTWIQPCLPDKTDHFPSFVSNRSACPDPGPLRAQTLPYSPLCPCQHSAWHIVSAIFMFIYIVWGWKLGDQVFSLFPFLHFSLVHKWMGLDSFLCLNPGIWCRYHPWICLTLLESHWHCQPVT